MSSGWYTNGYCRRRVSASELLKRVVMLLAHLGAPAPGRADAPPKPQLHALFRHHSDGRPVPIVGIGWVFRKDSYPEILAGSRRVSRDRRHSRPVSPFSSGLNSSRRVSIILSLVSRSRVHHCPSGFRQIRNVCRRKKITEQAKNFCRHFGQPRSRSVGTRLNDRLRGSGG
jgi:hypothetical protein